MLARRNVYQGLLVLLTILLIPTFIVLFLLFSNCAKKRVSTPTYPVAIVNQSSHDVCYVRLPPSGSYHVPPPWNLLRASLFSSRKLLSGQTTTFYVAQNLYDLRIRTCDHMASGTDYYKVPPNDRWIVSDDDVYPIVR